LSARPLAATQDMFHFQALAQALDHLKT